MKWLKEQVSGVADWMDEEHCREWTQTDKLFVTTEEVEKYRTQIRGLEEELERANEYTAIMAKMGPNTSTIELEALAKVQINEEPVASIAPVNDVEQEHEVATLKEEL